MVSIYISVLVFFFLTGFTHKLPFDGHGKGRILDHHETFKKTTLFAIPFILISKKMSQINMGYNFRLNATYVATNVFNLINNFLYNVITQPN